MLIVPWGIVGFLRPNSAARRRRSWQALSGGAERAREGGQVTLAQIGRFQVERMLGTGSFATVWLARDEDLDAWVAIKLLAENWSLNEDARHRFIEEARALR